jgi:NADPH2:quinone reductase
MTGRNPQAVAQAGGDVAICSTRMTRFANNWRRNSPTVSMWWWIICGVRAENILMAAAKTKSALRYVQVGSLSGGEITLPGAFLRYSTDGKCILTLSQLLTATQSYRAVLHCLHAAAAQ